MVWALVSHDGRLFDCSELLGSGHYGLKTAKKEDWETGIEKQANNFTEEAFLR